MAKRIIEIMLPEGRVNDIGELLHEHVLEGIWQHSINNKKAVIRILLNRNKVEPVLDILEPYLETLPDATAVLFNVEATIPRNVNGKEEENNDTKETGKRKSERISRQELYNDISTATGITSTYLVMIALAAVVAAIGLMRNDMAIIIGAMVMAPLLVPNVAVALANTLGDTELAMKGLKTTGVGLLFALTISISLGLLFTIDPATHAIAARTQIKISDLVLAMASGAAGVLAFTSGGQLSLIGVMVAVALMPPLVSSGLLIGSGHPALGVKALELTLSNVICVNIAGILTFTIQGIHPATWWEKNRASHAKRKALTVWMFLLVLLMVILFR